VQRTPAKTEYRSSKFPVELPPGFEVARPGSGDALSQLHVV
jgi:hypothetical protein